MEEFLKYYDPRIVMVEHVQSREDAFLVLQHYVTSDGKGRRVVGVNVFDASIAATYLVLCQLYGKQHCIYYKRVFEWLVRVKEEGKLHYYTWWTRDQDLLVDMAINGVDTEKVKQIENLFNCIILAPRFSICLEKVRKALPGSCKILLIYPIVMSMPPWAVPGVLVSTLIRDYDNKGLCFQQLLSKTRAYYKQIFNNYAWPFENFHQTTFQVALYTVLANEYQSKDVLEVLNRSWLLLNKLVEANGYVTRFRLPVWDTAWTVLSLSRSTPGEVLLQRELCEYLAKVQQPDGGWAFTDERHPSDNDDTALAILALLECGNIAAADISKAVRLLLHNQRLEGGWATYGKGNWSKTTKYIPSIRKDIWWTLRDAPVADVTSHVIWALSRLYNILDLRLRSKISKAVGKTIRWLYADTFWEGRAGYLYGRWTQTFVPTTSHAVIALHEALQSIRLSRDDKDIAEELLEAYIAWLKRYCWNGCGESWQSYHEGHPCFEEHKTIEHSLVAQLALLRAGENPPINLFDKSLKLGVNMAAFDVYTNTVVPIYLLLLVDKEYGG